MNNWQTSVAGLIFSIGTALTANEDPMYKHIGIALQGIGGLLGFYWAKDKQVTGVGEDARRVE